MVFSSVVFAAALDAGGFLAQGFHARQHGGAFGTGVKKLPRDFAAFEGKFVTAGLIRNTEVGASLTPFHPVGLDAAASGAVLRQKVSQFVTKSSLNLGSGNLDELGVQQNRALAKHRHAGRGAERGIPINPGLKIAAADRLEKLIGKILQQGILAQPGIAPGLFYIVRLGANPAHDGAPEIKKQLTVFHAAKAG